MKHYRFASPYMLGLMLFGFALVTFTFSYVVHFPELDFQSPGGVEIIMLSLVFSFYGLLIYISDQWSMMYKVDDYGFHLHALFRKPLHIPYSEIRYACIDYGVLDQGRQFWLCFSKNPFPKEFLHNVNKLPKKLKKGIICIQFNMNIYNELLHCGPPDFRKRLLKCSSTIRLYGLDEK